MLVILNNILASISAMISNNNNVNPAASAPENSIWENQFPRADIESGTDNLDDVKAQLMTLKEEREKIENNKAKCEYDGFTSANNNESDIPSAKCESNIQFPPAEKSDIKMIEQYTVLNNKKYANKHVEINGESYNFDQQGRVIYVQSKRLHIVYNNEGEIDSYSSYKNSSNYKYDSQGNLLSITKYETDKNNDHTRYVYNYKDNQPYDAHFVRYKNCYIDSQDLSEEIYDKNGNMVDRRKYLPYVERLSEEEIETIVEFNNSENANKKGIIIDGLEYDFDTNGNVTSIKENGEGKYELTYSQDGELETITLHTKDNYDGSMLQINYLSDGEIDTVQKTKLLEDGKKLTQNIDYYDYDVAHSVDETICDENGKILSKSKRIIELGLSGDGIQISQIYSDDIVSNSIIRIKDKDYDMSTITPEELSEMLDDIDNVHIIKNELNNTENMDNISCLMFYYHQQTGRSFLTDLAANKEYSRELVDIVVQRVTDSVKMQYDTNYAGQRITDENGEAIQSYKYIKDIERDMQSHPDDYDLLTVDLIRIGMRGKIYVKEQNNGKYGRDEDFSINNEIDEPINQGNTGNCYFISSILNGSKKPLANEFLKSAVDVDTQNETVTVQLKGVNKEYTISFEEIKEADHLSTGDYTMRAHEIALDKYKRDLAYEGIKNGKTDFYYDSGGGYLSDFTKAYFGMEAEENVENYEISDFNNETMLYLFSIQAGDYKNTNYKAKTQNGEEKELVCNHEYSIIGSDKKNVYFINPHDGETILKMSIKEFKQMENLEINRFDLTKISA